MFQGKTYTLMGTPDEPGLTILAIHEVFSHIFKTTGTEFLARVSYIEIYNEEIKDLLEPSDRRLRVLDDPRRGPYVKNAKEEVVLSPEHCLELIARGEQNRHIASTNMNTHSSRSHTLFIMVLESRLMDVSEVNGDISDEKCGGRTSGQLLAGWTGKKKAVKVSRLNLVDLAGSERVSKTGATGQRLKEGSMINKSLLTLSTVISHLSSGKGGHIPYRDSKLTRLLSSSIGGNACTAEVCAVSPAKRNIGETRST